MPQEPRIGVIYNPRSHRNQGRDIECARRPEILVAQPGAKSDIAAELAEFADRKIDYLIINGGDGTVRDVLTMGQDVFGENWPALAVLPKGKTNALNVDLGAPANWTLPGAIAAYGSGRRMIRRPLAIHNCDVEARPLLGFIMGAGAFTLGIRAGQDAHRIGFFNSLAVAMTAGWGVLQALLGSDANPWRRGTEMTVSLLPDGREVPHSGHGDPARRSLIFATTLHCMPAGARPFGTPRPGLKLVVIDKTLRRMLVSSPAILAGWRPRWLTRNGYHQVDTEGFELDVGDEFILDGEAFAAGRYRVTQGPELTFIAP
jgi:diacylglycerol kinase (ATP)